MRTPENYAPTEWPRRRVASTRGASTGGLPVMHEYLSAAMVAFMLGGTLNLGHEKACA